MRIQLRESLLYWLMRMLKRLDRRDTAAAAFAPDRVRSILVISSTALGDTVMSTAAISALRERYPAAQMTALIHRAYVPLFARLPELDHVAAYDGGYRRFWRTALTLRNEQPGLAVILHGNEPQATPLAYLSGARFIFKLPNISRFRFLLSNQSPLLDWPQLGHGIAQRLRTAALADARGSQAGMRLPVTSEAVTAVQRFLGLKRVGAAHLLIGLQTGASSRGRMWPAAHFVALAHAMQSAHPAARFVLTGAPAEAAYCGEIAKLIGPTALLANELPIELLPALLAQCRVLVTGDTGTMHVAVAVGTPVVALFAVSNPATSGPIQDVERHAVIHRPCPELKLRSKSDDQGCIARIGVAEVRAEVERLLAQAAPEANP